MLNRSQTKLLLFASFFDPKSQFYRIPKEIIRHIKYSLAPDPDFLAALKDVAYAQLEPLRTRLEKAKNDQTNRSALPSLLLQASDVITPAGLLVQGITLLECAICAGDPEMVAMLKPYFSAFKGGEEEMIIQLGHCQPAIAEMESQKPDDLTWLIEVILASKPEHIREELKTGDEYDKNYSSPLRDALNKFRQDKLESNRIITTPKMHCNYQNLIHAYEILDTYWDQLKTNGSYDKHDLFARLVIGFIQLTELTGLDRQLFAQGKVEATTRGKTTSRTFEYRYADGSFPDFDQTSIDNHLGAGFNFHVSILCGRCDVAEETIAVWYLRPYTTYIEQKLQTYRTYAAHSIEKSRVYNSLV